MLAGHATPNHLILPCTKPYPTSDVPGCVCHMTYRTFILSHPTTAQTPGINNYYCIAHPGILATPRMGNIAILSAPRSSKLGSMRRVWRHSHVAVLALCAPTVPYWYHCYGNAPWTDRVYGLNAKGLHTDASRVPHGAIPPIRS